LTPHSWTSLGTYRYISDDPTKVPTAFTSTRSFAFRGSNFNITSNAITSLYKLTCGYRTILDTTNYIDPSNNAKLSTTVPAIDGKLFTSMCNNDDTTLKSDWSTYLAKGVYLNDSGWTLVTGKDDSWATSYSDNVLNEDNLGSSGYLYYHTSLIVATNGAFNYGYVVVKTLWEGKDTSYPKPSWDYTDNESAEWVCGGLYSLTSPNP
jgi:hypothetical protein